MVLLASFLQESSLKVVLDGQSPPLYITLFLVFINDLPGEVLSRIGIYADDITLYSSLGKSEFFEGKSEFFENVESAGELELDLRSIVEWGDSWLVTFNATKTKLLSFDRHRDPLLVPVGMNGIELPEETFFVCLA